MLRCVSTVKSSVPRPSRFTLDKDNIVVGRDPDKVDILLDSTRKKLMISRIHARLERHERDGGGYTLKDNKSTNGVYVNNKRERGPVDLKNGDIIVFGVVSNETEFKFQYDAPPPKVAKEAEAPKVTATSSKADIEDDDDSDERPTKKRHIEIEGTSSSATVTVAIAEQPQQPGDAEPVKGKTTESSGSAGSQKGAHVLAEGLVEELMCTICQGILFNAVTLQCSHSFCKECIEGWISKMSGGSKKCPICREPVPHSGVPARALDSTIEKMVASLEDSEEKEEYLERKKEKEEETKKLEVLRKLREEAKKRKFKFLDITKRWTDQEKDVFTTNIALHTGRTREEFCKYVGLTPEFIDHTPAHQISVAVENTINKPPNDVRERREALRRLLAGLAPRVR